MFVPLPFEEGARCPLSQGVKATACLLHDNLLHLVALLDNVEASGERLGAVANECARGAIDLHLAIGS